MKEWKPPCDLVILHQFMNVSRVDTNRSAAALWFIRGTSNRFFHGTRISVPIIIALLGLNGCFSTGIVPMDKDTYMVAKRASQVGLGPPIGPKADVYRQATAFCGKQGKVVETITLDLTNSAIAQPGAASLQFRCINDGAEK
jgi:hypothetical protein